MSIPPMNYRPDEPIVPISLHGCGCGCVAPSVTVTTTGTTEPVGVIVSPEGWKQAPWHVTPWSGSLPGSTGPQGPPGPPGASGPPGTPVDPALVESVAERVDELLDRSQILNEKLNNLLTEQAEARIDSWVLPVVGDRVWSRATGEGPFHVILNVVTDVIVKTPMHDMSSNRFNGVDACVVRTPSGSFITLPAGDLTVVQPEGRPAPARLPVKFYFVAALAATLTTLAGQLVGFWLFR